MNTYCRQLQGLGLMWFSECFWIEVTKSSNNCVYFKQKTKHLLYLKIKITNKNIYKNKYYFNSVTLFCFSNIDPLINKASNVVRDLLQRSFKSYKMEKKIFNTSSSFEIPVNIKVIICIKLIQKFSHIDQRPIGKDYWKLFKFGFKITVNIYYYLFA